MYILEKTIQVKKNTFIKSVIHLSVERWKIKSDVEDTCDVVYNILEDFDDTIINNCVDDLEREYLVDIYNIENKCFPIYDNRDLIFCLIDYILETEYELY